MIRYLGESVPVAEFQFHPPPLFSLIVGGWLSLFGVDNLYQFPMMLVRLPSFFISVLVLIVLLLSVRKYCGIESALLAGLFYCLFPTNVAMNTLVKADNLLALVSIVTLLFLMRCDLSKARDKLALVFLVALAIISKEVGLYLVLAVFTYLFSTRAYRYIYLPVLGVVFGEGAYLLYAYIFSWEDFIFTVQAIESEGVKLSSFYRVMFENSLYGLVGCPVFCWLGLLLSKREGQSGIFLIFSMAYVVAYGIISPGNFLYPWHQIVLYLFWSVGFAVALKELFIGPSSNKFLLFAVLFVALNLVPFFNIELDSFISSLSPVGRRVMLSSVGGFLLIPLVLPKKIPDFILPVYYFILLGLGYYPFVYILLTRNYV